MVADFTIEVSTFSNFLSIVQALCEIKFQTSWLHFTTERPSQFAGRENFSLFNSSLYWSSSTPYLNESVILEAKTESKSLSVTSRP